MGAKVVHGVDDVAQAVELVDPGLLAQGETPGEAADDALQLGNEGVFGQAEHGAEGGKPGASVHQFGHRQGAQANLVEQVCDRIAEDAVGWPVPLLGGGAVAVGFGQRTHQPEQRQGGVQCVFQVDAGADGGGLVHAHQDAQIIDHGLGRGLVAEPLLDETGQGIASLGKRKLGLVEVVEEPAPDGRLGAVGGEQPVDQPDRGLVFQIGVEPVCCEHGLTQGGGAETRGPALGDAGRLEPVVDSGHHVFADAQGNGGLVGVEGPGIDAHGLEPLGQPGVAQVEGLVPTEGRLVETVLQRLAGGGDGGHGLGVTPCGRWRGLAARGTAYPR